MTVDPSQQQQQQQQHYQQPVYQQPAYQPPVQPETNPAPPPPTAPHPPIAQRPVVVHNGAVQQPVNQNDQLAQIGQYLQAMPEQIVNALREGAAQQLPPPQPHMQQPAAQHLSQQTTVNPLAPIPQNQPPAGQQTAVANSVDAGQKQPNKFLDFWFRR